MDDSEDESRYPSKYYSMTRQATQNYPSPTAKPPKRNPQYYTQYRKDDISDDEDEFDEQEENPGQDLNDNRGGNIYSYNDEAKRHPKKRRLGELASKYELAPRSGSNQAGRSSRGNSWSEEESFVLLEVWGERYMELGRRSLRGEDWVDVAEKVSEMSGVDRDVMECRNQLDVLKKKYRKERTKMEQIGGGFVSKWVFYKKLDVLLNLKSRGRCGLGCGVDSGEYVFMNPHVYLDRSNVLDEMRDSPAESDEDNEDEEEGVGDLDDDGQSAKLLAESIQKFGEIYEKIETNKRKQMMELEKMRRDFQRDLEMQKQEIVERAQAEIAKLREIEDDDDDDDDDSEDDGNDDDDSEDDGNDGSMENLRG